MNVVNQFTAKISGFLFVLCLILSFQLATANAQDDGDWTVQKQIPGYDPESEAYLFVDSSGTVHSFSNKLFDGQLLIIYSKWVDGRGWTDPVDIFLPQLKNQARVADVFLDKEGTIHLAFFSGDDLGAAYYYSQVHVTQANQASAWTEPIIIGDQAATPATSAFIPDKDGYPTFIYHSDIVVNGLYVTYTLDGGETWLKDPQIIFRTNSSERWPSSLKAYVDNLGTIHAVWGMVDVTGNSLAVYYAQTTAADQPWSQPVVLDKAVGFEADTPSIIRYNDELIVIYHNSLPTTRWMRRSIDNGLTWSDPISIFPEFAGTNGPASLVIDGDNVLSMFFGNRTGGSLVFGMWQSIWNGEQWSTPVAVVSGERIQDRLGGIGFDPSFAKAEIVNGNLLFLTWTTDPGAGLNGTWYVYKQLNNDPIPTIVLPTVTPAPTATPTPTPQIEPTRDPTAGVPGFQEDVPGPSGINSSFALFLGMIVALFFSLSVLGYKFFTSSLR